jgi:hypothetical protein
MRQGVPKSAEELGTPFFIGSKKNTRTDKNIYRFLSVV